MLTNFKIDQGRTFAGVVFLSCQPKLKFGSQTEQETTKDGRFKWDVEVLGAVYTPFGGTENQVLKVSMAAKTDPAEGVPPFQPVELGDFEVGVMADEKKDRETGEKKIVGARVWYRASEIKLAGQAKATGKAA